MPLEDYDPVFAKRVRATIGHTFPMYSPMHLPSPRGIWPLGNDTVGQNSNDISGQGRHLTDAGAVTYDIDNFMSYVNLNGTNEYLFRADESPLDITDVLGMGCWVYFDNAPSAFEVIMGKSRPGTNNRSYRLSRATDGTITAMVSSNGTATTTITSTQVVSANTWAFVHMSYDPSTALSVFVGTVGGDDGLLEKTTNTTSIPGSINAGGANFAIGAQNTGGTPSDLMTGRASLAYLCAALMPDKMPNLIYAQARELLVV